MPEWLRNLLLAVGTLAVSGAVVETCARAVDLRPAAGGNAIPAWVDDRQLRREAHWIELVARQNALARYFELYEWDRFRFYRVRPDLELEMLDYAAPPSVRPRTAWTVRTNALGFRDAPLKPRPDPAARGLRVLALGDSSTFGWGVPAEATYAAVAQSVLLREGREVEVRNLGQPGYSSFQGLVLLRRVAPRLEPDALLFSFGSNDRTPTGVADREVHARRASALGALQALAHRSRAYETLAAFVASARGRARPGAARLARGGRENVTRTEFADNLRAAVSWARTRDLPIAFVGSCLDREGLRVTARVARETGVPFVSGYDTMVSRIPQLRSGALLSDEVTRLRETYGEAVLAREPLRYVLLPDGCHPNRVGHRLIGEAVADVARAWLPPASSPTR